MQSSFHRPDPEGQRAAVRSYGGILAAFISDFATFFDCSEEEVIEALEHVDLITNIPSDDHSRWHASFSVDQIETVKSQIEMNRTH